MRQGVASDLHGARLRLERRPELLQEGTAAVLWAILDKVVDDYAPVVEGLERDIEQVEATVFGGAAAPTERIYFLRREATDFYRAVHPLLGPLDGLERGTYLRVSNELRQFFRDVNDHLKLVNEEVVAQRDLLAIVLQANMAVISVEQTEISVRQNETTKQLTVMATIFLPLTFVTGFFGMNFGWLIGHITSLWVFLVVRRRHPRRLVPRAVAVVPPQRAPLSVRRARRLLRRLGERVHAPRVVDALEQVAAAVAEAQRRAQHELLDRARDEDLARPGQPGDAGAEVHRDPGQVAARTAALAGVDAGTQLESQRPDGVAHARGPADRAAGAVEDDEEAVAGALDLVAAGERELAAEDRVVLGQQPRPALVAEGGGVRRGVDDVGEDDRGEDRLGGGAGAALRGGHERRAARDRGDGVAELPGVDHVRFLLRGHRRRRPLRAPSAARAPVPQRLRNGSRVRPGGATS